MQSGHSSLPHVWSMYHLLIGHLYILRWADRPLSQVGARGSVPSADAGIGARPPYASPVCRTARSSALLIAAAHGPHVLCCDDKMAPSGFALHTTAGAGACD